MNNADIRNEMKMANLAIWKVADKLGVCEMTLVRWFRKELSTEKKERICSIITELKGGATNA